jgi:glycosyltransferase involved in cell wall biosynthesis
MGDLGANGEAGSGEMRHADVRPSQPRTLPGGQRIVIFAPNVRTGGGLVLLRALLEADWPVAERVAYLDERARDSLPGAHHAFRIEWVAPGIFSRLRAERRLARRSRMEDETLCFHNLPPLLPVRGEVSCYLQNAYVIGDLAATLLQGKARVRTILERLIARRLRHRCSRFIVQTPTMRDKVAKWLGDRMRPVDVLPIAPKLDVTGQPVGNALGGCRFTRPDFVYVSDGQPHKNHRRLFAAWKLLARSGEYPSLVLTLNTERDSALRAEVHELAEEGLAIEDVGTIPRGAVRQLFRRSGALIFPSTGESFGNPLFEASYLGLPILAPELDYVRDVCEPAQTFDPFSPRSIARAVQRFRRVAPDRITPLSGDEFAAELLRSRNGGNSLAFHEAIGHRADDLDGN